MKNKQLVVQLKDLSWLTEEFTMTGSNNIPRDVIGVYRLLSADGGIQRIGQGRIRNRVLEYLKDSRFTRIVRAVEYCSLSDKDDAVLMEQVLLTRYKQQYGDLPPLNLIHA